MCKKCCRASAIKKLPALTKEREVKNSKKGKRFPWGVPITAALLKRVFNEYFKED
jgi:hypothetical protein